MVGVSIDDINFFQRNGVVVIRNLLDANQVEELAEAIDWNIDNPSHLGQTASRNTDPGHFFEDFCNWQRIPAYRNIIFDSDIGSIAASLMGSEEVRLFHDHMLVKEPATKQPTPWHQDLPYYNIEGTQNISFWIPVDPVSNEATLEFVAGSNDGTWYMPKTFLTESAKWFPEGSLAEVPEIDSEPGLHEILSWELKPGDAVAFHMLTLHGSRGSTNRRRAFSVRVMGEDIRHAPREWRTSPEFEGLRDELAVGVKMDHPLFPVIFISD